MKPNDLIFLNVTGTNGSTRHTKAITEKFNGEGLPINDQGQVISKPDRLENLPNGAGTPAPDFPFAEYQAAQAKGAAGSAEMAALQVAHAKRFEAWQKSNEGGDELVKLARAALDYTKKFHDFRESDEGEFFVLKPENIDVVTNKLSDGRMLYQVTGTAVFGR